VAIITPGFFGLEAAAFQISVLRREVILELETGAVYWTVGLERML
jgi:hypothetical protein